jgi:hypothetical protein
MCLSHLIYTVRPCLIHTCYAAPMPCSDHAILLKTTARDGRRETACGRPARVRLLPATTRSSTKVGIRNIPISDAGGHCETKQRLSWTRKSGSSTLQKRHSNCWTSSWDISGYHADFHEGHGTVGAGQGNGIGAAWARHGRGMLCVNRPQISQEFTISATGM